MKKLALSAALVGLLASSGCADPTGGLVISYRLGSGTQSCSEVGIATIRVRLEAAERADLPEETAPCSGSSGEIVFNNIPADVYSVIVEGLDIEENVVFEGRLESVVVQEDQITETELVRLSIIEPRMYLVWRFANGFMCGQNNVDELEFVVYRQGVNPDVTETVPCDPGSYLVETGLAADSYDLRVRGIDATTGEYSFAYDEDQISLEAGLQRQVIVILDECEGECTAP